MFLHQANRLFWEAGFVGLEDFLVLPLDGFLDLWLLAVPVGEDSQLASHALGGFRQVGIAAEAVEFQMKVVGGLVPLQGLIGLQGLLPSEKHAPNPFQDGLLLGVGGGEYAPVRQELAVAKAAKAAIRPGQKVFLIHQGDEGFSWFLFNQQLCPALVYGEGGATYGEPALVEGMPYSAPYTEEEFSALLKAEQVDLLLVSRVNGIFEESYAALFTDGLAAAKQGPALYEKSEAGWTPAASLAGEVTG